MPPQFHRKPDGILDSSQQESKEFEFLAFARLFAQAYRKCFASDFASPLTESESHRFSVDIGESTGLEIGWKSLKNYSSYLLGKPGRVENPSVPTLDTLARYVAGAPTTDEERRRTRERHYPYWFRYKEALRPAEKSETPPQPGELTPAERGVPQDSGGTPAGRQATTRVRVRVFLAVAVASLAALLVAAVLIHRAGKGTIADEFDDVSGKGLAERGWSVRSLDTVAWARRDLRPGHLTLFTLRGDNWPQPASDPIIRNLLLRASPADCFVADVRLTSFVPRENWQQAGIILLEDTSFARKSVRMSIGFNDFSGGFPQTREIIIQAITSQGREFSNPEEIVHHRLFVEEPGTRALIDHNLGSVALRIEKHGRHLRLLYAGGPFKNAPFKEVGATDLDFRPAYVAVFAIKGFVSQAGDIPAYVDAFNLSASRCSP